MPPSHPFSAEFLSREWPLLREACSFPGDRARITMLASDVRDPESLFRLAEEHGVIARLAATVLDGSAHSLPPEFLDKLLARRRLQSVFTLAMTAELFRIVNMLQDAGIDAVVVKGPVLSLRAYGDPAARRYADIDLVVRHKEISRVAEILTSAGFRSKIPLQSVNSGKAPGEYVFRHPQNQLLFEFHTERTLRYFPRGVPIEDYFARRTPVLLDGRPIPALSTEDEFILICIHGAKHFWERLQLISDVAALVQNRPDLEWERVRTVARAVGAETILHLALLLAERTLTVPVPAAIRTDVKKDQSCEALAGRIETWLPYAGFAPPAFAERALFRFRMRGGLLAGTGYLARLSVSTTEEDWAAGPDGRGARLSEIVRRPFRLVRKYRRNLD